MKLNTLKHRLETQGNASVDTVTFKINPDTERWIEKQKKKGNIEVTPSEHADLYLDIKVVEDANSSDQE